jgi:hypothetical protein
VVHPRILRSLRYVANFVAPIRIALLLVVASAARGDENLFGYSYGTETLPKGGVELYNWITWRTDKGQGTYDALDLRQEIEYGVTDRFQASLYLSQRYHHVHDSQPVEIENGEEEREYPNRNEFAFDGVQTEFKYSFLSPYLDPLGFALYAEPGWSRISKESGKHEDALSIEVKALFQKNFLEDTLIAVLNVSPEYEWAKGKGIEHWENELELEVTGGLTYRVAPRWYAGVESRYTSEYPNFPDESHREFWGVFVGPALHYATTRWWATVTALPQVYGQPHDGDRSHTLHLDDLEAFELRIKMGFNF